MDTIDATVPSTGRFGEGESALSRCEALVLCHKYWPQECFEKFIERRTNGRHYRAQLRHVQIRALMPVNRSIHEPAV